MYREFPRTLPLVVNLSRRQLWRPDLHESIRGPGAQSGMEGVGVEIEEQETLLREMGCDFAQGFYLAKPLPVEEVPGFLSV